MDGSFVLVTDKVVVVVAAVAVAKLEATGVLDDDNNAGKGVELAVDNWLLSLGSFLTESSVSMYCT